MSRKYNTLVAMAGVAIFLPGLAIAAPIRAGTYYESYATASCTTPIFSCVVTFTPTPADVFLTVTRVACNLRRTAVITRAYLGLNLVDRFAFISVPQPSVDAGFNYYNFSQETEFKVGRGKTLNVVADTEESSTGYMNCTVTGVLSNT